jgi:hypothetical protein
MSPVTEAEKAWLACAIDGEGSITWHIDKRNLNNRIHPRIVVYNNNIDFVQHAADIMDKIVPLTSSVHSEKRTPIKSSHQSRISLKNPNWGTTYKIQMYGLRCKAVINEILPYLIIKRDRALYVLSLKLLTKEEVSEFRRQKVLNQPRIGARWTSWSSKK